MAALETRFTDLQTHWAKALIVPLIQRRIINGFPDNTFRPDRPVTRAEFAALLLPSLALPAKRPYIPFIDVPADHWAATAIRRAYEAGFLSGFPNHRFELEQAIPRWQVWLSLVGGLGLRATAGVPLRELFQDIDQAPSWTFVAIAAATEAELVVNHPNLRQLQPNQPATRAEVAAILYQALVQQGKAPAIASPYIVRPTQPLTATVSHTREFRAVWLTSVWNQDFPSRQGLSSQQQQAELITLLDQVQALNLNALILQVRPEGDALYASPLEPWSHWLTGKQGKPPEPFYDPLEFAIRACHDRNLELHAWFNPYRARTTKSTVNVRPHLAVTNPNVVYEWGNQLWLDPGAKVVEDRTYSVIMDVVRRYDIDGIHLDDYFYPYPIAGKTFPDAKTYQAYRVNGGNLALSDWRRENVNRLVQRLAQGIRAAKPKVKFGISPFGIYRPGQPAQIQGLDAYAVLYADALKWLQQGWVDYLAPQLYWRIDPPAQSYPTLLNWWTQNNPKQRHIYAGNNLAQLDGKAWDLSEITRQVDLTRQLNSQLALGNIFFSLNGLRDNRQGVQAAFRATTYRQPALPPAMKWLSTQPPSPPKAVQATNRTLTWQPMTEVRAWSLYRQTADNRWSLNQILPRAKTTVSVEPGTYALCAVDRLAQESTGVVVTIR